MNTQPIEFAWFITPHGFGHAARSAAVMLAVQRRIPAHFHIYTQVPEWFFQESHLDNYTYHNCLTDIGLAQKNSLEEDLSESLNRLNAFYPFNPDQIGETAAELARLHCRMVIADIAPMGIAAAEKAGIPSVLVENFTWDWIYETYLAAAPGFDKYIKYLADWFGRASARIQTQPVCNPIPSDLLTQPVSRPVRTARTAIRARLNIPENQPAVLVTMGGIETAFDFLSSLSSAQDTCFIIPGGGSREIHQDNLRLLPHHSGFYHPDLAAASDAIIGKLGYSTLSEACITGIPYGYIPRRVFRESPPLARFVRESMSGLEISEQEYQRGEWINRIPELLQCPRKAPPAVNGADQIAEWIISRL